MVVAVVLWIRGEQAACGTGDMGLGPGSPRGSLHFSYPLPKVSKPVLSPLLYSALLDGLKWEAGTPGEPSNLRTLSDCIIQRKYEELNQRRWLRSALWNIKQWLISIRYSKWPLIYCQEHAWFLHGALAGFQAGEYRAGHQGF